ncbi:MAG: hypothetical protein RLZZ227_1762 [Pseudomonadota bacterium]|jgi:hypothetical protein
MNKTPTQSFAIALGSMVALAAILFLSSQASLAADTKARLEGAQEVPAVDTAASGTVDIKVADDGSVSGSVSTTGVSGTMAHIHTGASGANGPPIVTLTKQGDTYSVPADSKLTAEQLELYRKGELYVNVHSAAHAGGEIRAQLN